MAAATAATRFFALLLAIVASRSGAEASLGRVVKHVDPREIALVDDRGVSTKLADYAGEALVVTFVASRCTDVCPIANGEFARVRALVRRDRLAARLLTITLDPAYDTPFVLARVAHEFSLGTDRSWRFATGRPRDVETLTRAFGVVARKNKVGVPDVHGSLVYVLDRRGRLATTLLLSTSLDRDVEFALRHLPAATAASASAKRSGTEIE